MPIIYVLLGGVAGWVLHAILSFKKFGDRLNEAEKKVWAMTPKNERMQKRIEIIKKHVPSMNNQELWSYELAFKMDQEEFPEQYTEEEKKLFSNDDIYV